MSRATKSVSIRRARAASSVDSRDVLAVEEPLEIRIGWDDGGRRTHRGLAITMRTPGADEELAAGFLFSEGVVRFREDLLEIRSCGPAPGGSGNVVRAELAAGRMPDWARLSRNVFTSSSCGVCGKSSIEALRSSAPFAPPDPREPRISPSLLHDLPARLLGEQGAFAETGGLHASALFDAEGRLRTVREDVGRHNALDKVVGQALLAGDLPLRGTILLLSGRTSFELVQKAAMAGIPFVASVGAPSSLAVELARESGLTLIGFLRDDRFNVYAGAERVAGASREDAA